MRIINKTRYNTKTLRVMVREVWARANGRQTWWKTASITFLTHSLPKGIRRCFPYFPASEASSITIGLPKGGVESTALANALWRRMTDVDRTDFGFVSLKFAPMLVERPVKVATPEEKSVKRLKAVQAAIARTQSKIKWQTTHLATLRRKEKALTKKLPSHPAKEKE